MSAWSEAMTFEEQLEDYTMSGEGREDLLLRCFFFLDTLYYVVSNVSYTLHIRTVKKCLSGLFKCSGAPATYSIAAPSKAVEQRVTQCMCQDVLEV